MLAGQTNLDGKLLFEPRGSHYYLVASRYDITGYKYKSIVYNTSISLTEISKAEADAVMVKMSVK